MITNSLRSFGMLAMLVGASIANAGLPKPTEGLKFSGEFRLRTQIDSTQTGDSDTNPTSNNDWNQRIKLFGEFWANKKVGARVSLIHSSQWGTDFVNDGNSGLGQADGTGNGENLPLVNEAYGIWIPADHWFFEFGRPGLSSIAGFGDYSVYSKNDWGKYPLTWDGVIAVYHDDWGSVTGFGLKTLKFTYAQGAGAAAPENNALGIRANIKPSTPFLKDVWLYAVKYRKDQTTVAFNPGLDVTFASVSLFGDVGPVDYGLDYGMNSGKVISGATKNDYNQHMMHAEFGFNMPEVMKSRIYVNYHQDTGQKDTSDTTKNETYDGWFYDKHKFAGWMDVVGFGNLTYYSLGYSLAPTDTIDVGLQYLMFSRTEADTTSAGVTADANGSLMFAGLTANDESDIGSELDIQATKKYYDGAFETMVLAGLFMPGKYLKENNKKDTYKQILLQAKINF